MTTSATTATDAIAANFDDLGEFLDGFDEIVQSMDEETCVIMRALLDDLMGQARTAVYATDQRILALVGPGESVQVPGCGQVVVEAKGKQTTDGTKLALHLGARIADTPCDKDGAALPPAELCRLTVEEIVAVFGLNTPSTSFRSGELKKRGMRPGEFRSFEDGEPKVRFLR